MAIPSINNVLNQMNTISNPTPINTQGVLENFTAQPVEFASFLSSALDKVSAAQNSSRAQAEAFERGEPGIDLTAVMIDLQKASVGMQLTVQVRNRIVQAYQEIMNMPV
ncbi:flagellar hook-basal body complex protein FliE [Thorsellia kenyensis]|uniref:Flagellar hook-basal body complex protein FliE n=1 Tax=Thorsellia kenyensis TaxID=1549888 RepID=A0ABV6CAL5_9GAMM